jgi:hypothetical protein
MLFTANCKVKLIRTCPLFFCVFNSVYVCSWQILLSVASLVLFFDLLVCVHIHGLYCTFSYNFIGHLTYELLLRSQIFYFLQLLYPLFCVAVGEE